MHAAKYSLELSAYFRLDPLLATRLPVGNLEGAIRATVLPF
jgi:hypothetical protein